METQIPHKATSAPPRPSAEDLQPSERTRLLSLLQQDDARAAKREATALAKRRPSAALPHAALGVLAARRGAYADALGHFEAAARRAPADPDPLRNTLRVAAALRRFDLVASTYDKLAELGVELLTAEMRALRAVAYLEGGESAAARAAAAEALALDPTARSALSVFGQAVEKDPTPLTSDAERRALAKLLADPKSDSLGAQRVAAISVAAALEADAADGAETIDLKGPTLALATALLSHGQNMSAALEAALTPVRGGLLRRILDAGPEARLDAEALALCEAMARHGFFTEFVWPESDAERAGVEALSAALHSRLEAGQSVGAAALFILGAYRPLAQIPSVRAWILALADRNPAGVDETLRYLVLDPCEEETLGAELPALSEIDAGVSSAVRAQYEENPYPRWRKITLSQPRPHVDVIADAVAPARWSLRSATPRPNVLIAGCGTGRHPIMRARSYAGAAVLAVDLSRASLAYGARQARRLGVNNLRFAQADLLRLEGYDATFDIVEASGVLHHMAAPEAGLAKVTTMTQPGGFLYLGLYSRAARRLVTDARRHIAASGLRADLSDLRAFRSACLSGAAPELSRLTEEADFFSASNLRDLVFHVQEHQFDLLEIKEMLARHGLDFLGFAALPEVVRRAYGAASPKDPTHTNLESWHAFEMRHPRTFAGMYQFWCRKN